MTSKKPLFDEIQLSLVERSELTFHKGLRHRSVTGSFYEDILIHELSKSIKELRFFKGQIVEKDKPISAQMDIMVCPPKTEQNPIFKGTNINVVEKKDVLAVIEVKKWAYPKMIEAGGPIDRSFKDFEKKFVKLKFYFVCFRYKDRLRKVDRNWFNFQGSLKTDGNFCFFGMTYKSDEDWIEGWKDKIDLLHRHMSFDGQYQRLVVELKTLIPK